MLIMPSLKKSLIVEQFQGNYLKMTGNDQHRPIGAMMGLDAVPAIKLCINKTVREIAYSKTLTQYDRHCK